MKLTGIVELPVFRSRIRTSGVRPPEMLLGYFLAPLLAQCSNAIFASYLNRFYGDVVGWDAFGAFSSLLPIVSVLFVVAGNLFVGQLIERTRTSQGKARPYILLAAPMLALAILLLFMIPTHAAPAVQMVWIALSYNLYYALAIPVFGTANSSMVALSTRNSDSRGLLSTMSNAAGVASAGLFASILIPVVMQSFLFVSGAGGLDREASLANWRTFALVLCVLGFLGALTQYFFTRERITEEEMKLDIQKEKIPIGRQLSVCVKEKYWWIVILFTFLFQLGGLVKNSTMSYYARWMFDSVVNRTDLSGVESAAGGIMSTIGMIGGIPTAVGMIVAYPIANRLGKQRAIQLGLAFSVLGGLVSFLNVHDTAVVCAGIVLKGIGTIPAFYVSLALVADVLDHMEAKNGFRCDGLTMSLYSSISIGLGGLATGILNAMKTFSGFVSSGYPVDLQAFLAGRDALLAHLSPTELQSFMDKGGEVVYRQLGGTEQVFAFCFLGLELICYLLIAGMMHFMDVEKYVKDDQKAILEHQKAAVLASGGTWIEPGERARQEQIEAERQEKEERLRELKARCAKKGLDWEKEEEKYQRSRAEKRKAQRFRDI